MILRRLRVVWVVALLAPHLPAQTVVKGGGTRRLTIGAGGFEPRSVRALTGELIKLSIVATDREHCFSLPQAAIEKRLRQGRTVIVDLAFEKPGSYPFSCCLEPGRTEETGTIVVTE